MGNEGTSLAAAKVSGTINDRLAHWVERNPDQLLFAFLDLLFAAAMLCGLVACAVGYLHMLNEIMAAKNGPPLLDMAQIVADIQEDPYAPAHYWIYFTIFTTFIPSLVNLIVGGLCVLRGIPGWGRLVYGKILPENPEEIGDGDRIGAALALTFEMVIAILFALCVLAVFWGIVSFGLSSMGLGLMDITRGILGVKAGI
mgnify:CR=1 FL=1